MKAVNCQTALHVSGLCLTRGQQTLQRDLNFSLQAGEALLITGDNGCGKTTLLQTIAGLLTPSAGVIDRADITARDIRYIGHPNGLWPHLSLAENCQLISRLHAVTDNDAWQKALQRFDLQDCQHVLAADCSAGQKRRCALAVLMFSPGRLWCLDEPFTALDQTAQAGLWQLLQAHCDKGGMLCMTSHQTLEQPLLPVKEYPLAYRH